MTRKVKPSDFRWCRYRLHETVLNGASDLQLTILSLNKWKWLVRNWEEVGEFNSDDDDNPLYNTVWGQNTCALCEKYRRMDPMCLGCVLHDPDLYTICCAEFDGYGQEGESACNNRDQAKLLIARLEREVEKLRAAR